MAKSNTNPSVPLDRTITLVGMMGAGKSAIGRQLAQRLGLRFVDADTEIESAAGCSIPEIFQQYGEEYFRAGERRVISRIVDDGPYILATGGGAFIDPETRRLLQERTTTVWLNAQFDVLWERVSKRSHRPLLQTSDPQATLKQLLVDRNPVYAEAQLTVISDRAPKEKTVDRVIKALTSVNDTASPDNPTPLNESVPK